MEPHITPLLMLSLCFLYLNLNLVLFQFSEFLQSYNKLSEICFSDCVNDFTSRDVKKSEVNNVNGYR